MSGRIKRSIDILIRGGFIILCFILTYLFNAISGFSYGNSVSMTESSEVKILTENGAEASYSVENGRIVVDIIKQGTNYDDITVLLSVDKVGFDTEYMRENLGSDAEKYKEHLDALAEGPWYGSIHYMMTGDSIFTTGDRGYTFTDAALGEYSENLLSKEANQLRVSDEMEFKKGDGAIVMFAMGSSLSGALPEGRYYITANLTLTGLTAEGEDTKDVLPAEIRLSLLLNIIKDSLIGTPFTSFFKISSLMTFYGMMVLFGMIFFGFTDLRSSFKIAAQVAEGFGEAMLVTVKTYVNGVCTGTSSYIDRGGSLFGAIVAFILSYMLFTLTIPIRLIIIIVKDIVHILIGDEYEDCYSLLGNALGCIGVYALLIGFVCLMAAAPFWLALPCIGIGILLIIPANKLCTNAEDNY